MRQPFLAAATAALLCAFSTLSTPAEAQPYYAGYVTCPIPPWYPRGWELMVRYDCYAPTYPYYTVLRPRPSYVPYRRPYRYVTYRRQYRPYLRPGWWW